MSSSMVNWMVDGVGRVNRMVDRVNGVDWVDNRYSSNFYFNFARSLFYINNSNWLDYCWSRSKVESWKGSWNWEGGNWSGLRGQDNRLGYPSSKSKWNGSTDWSRSSNWETGKRNGSCDNIGVYNLASALFNSNNLGGIDNRVGNSRKKWGNRGKGASKGCKWGNGSRDGSKCQSLVNISLRLRHNSSRFHINHRMLGEGGMGMGFVISRVNG